MHTFKKLALAAAIASAPMMATSMELLDDGMLSGVTGQDGISIALDTNITVDLAIEDTSGARQADVTPAADPNEPPSVTEVYTTHGGFITMKGLNIIADNVTVDIDSGSSGAGADKGVLVVGVDIGELTVNNIDLGVAGSSLEQGGTNANVIPADARDYETGLARAKAAVGESSSDMGTYTSVLKIDKLELKNSQMNIELGPEAENFLSLSTTKAIEVELDNFSLHDASANGGGDLSVEKIYVKSSITDATVAILEDGLQVTSGGGSAEMALMGVGIGNGADKTTIGNIYLLNMESASSSITITGR